MAKKMRVRSGGKHKVMSALAAASGLGNLAGRGRRSSSHKGFRYEVELKPKDLLSTEKLVALAVAKAAIDQLKTGAGEGLSSDERREVEKAVSALVSGEKFNPSSSAALGFDLKFEVDKDNFGKAALKIGDSGAGNMTTIGSRSAFDSLTVCPNKFRALATRDSQGNVSVGKELSPKARAAGQFAAQVMYNLLDTGLTTKKRKVYESDGAGGTKESVRLFLGPVVGSKDAKMELGSSVCYRIQLDKGLRQRAAANFFTTHTSAASSAVASEVAKIINQFPGGKGMFPGRKRTVRGDVEETVSFNGLGQMDTEESEAIMLDGMRRRRRKSRKSASRKSPVRRRKSSSKRKASRRRKK
jgi:hypothetical protein